MEELCEDHYACMFGDSSVQENVSMSGSLRHSSDFYLAKRASGLMRVIYLKFSEISAM